MQFNRQSGIGLGCTKVGKRGEDVILIEEETEDTTTEEETEDTTTEEETEDTTREEETEGKIEEEAEEEITGKIKN